jgi:hypothetical protein
MKRPSSRTMLLGHPLVAVPLALGSTGAIYACCHSGNNGLFPGLMFGAMLLAAARASKQASAYRQWAREWNAMAGEPKPRTRPLTSVLRIGLAVALMVGAYAVMLSDPHLTSQALKHPVQAGAPVLGLLIVTSLVRWLRRRPGRAATPVGPVTVAAKVILPAPPFDAAYAALPDYCQRLLARRLTTIDY